MAELDTGECVRLIASGSGGEMWKVALDFLVVRQLDQSPRRGNLCTPNDH
jgi:hypothetical protein